MLTNYRNYYLLYIYKYTLTENISRKQIKSLWFIKSDFVHISEPSKLLCNIADMLVEGRTLTHPCRC